MNELRDGASKRGGTITISIIVPVYNSGAFLYEAIESIRTQDVSVPIEIVIVDDRSTDAATLDALKHYSSLGENLRVIKNDGPRGPGAARNAGVRASTGEWIGFLDSDDIAPPGSFQKRLAIIMQYPEATWVAGEFKGFGHREIQMGDETLADCGARLDDKNVFIITNFAEQLVFKTFLQVGATFILRKQFFEVGGFNESFIYGEDWYLWMLLAELASLHFIKEIVLLHRRHPESLMGRDAFKSEEACKSLKRAYFDKRLRRVQRQIRWRLVKRYQKLCEFCIGEGAYSQARRFAFKAALWAPADGTQWRRWLQLCACIRR